MHHKATGREEVAKAMGLHSAKHTHPREWHTRKAPWARDWAKMKMVFLNESLGASVPARGDAGD